MNRLLAAALLVAGPLALTACDSGNGDDDIIRVAYVTRVIIDDFPVSNPAAGGWDGGGDGQADLYFRILGSNGVQLLNGEESTLVTADGQAGSRVFTDAGIEDIPVTFTVADFLIDALDRSLTVEVKDDDSPLSADDVIGESTSFRLEDHIPNPLPANRQAIVPFVSADSSVSGRLTVRFAS
jgi:hypothetical protein